MNRRACHITLIFLMGCLYGHASISNVVNNGSFEQGVMHWLLFGQSGGTQYALTNNVSDGMNALYAANRTNLSYHAVQNIITNLLAEGTGQF